MKINIIGDVAGRFGELMELLGKMPAADLVLGVGDLIDRGPQSKQVIEWFMGDPMSRESVFANHELMAVAAHWYWPNSPLAHPYWGRNGGEETIGSYGGQPMPAEHLNWLRNRPAWYASRDGLFVSHAPVFDALDNVPLRTGFDWKEWAAEADQGDESGWVWNRYLSKVPMPKNFMVYGHNSRYREHHIPAGDGTMVHYATCIDNSISKQLMGMAWPSRELFTVDYAG